MSCVLLVDDDADGSEAVERYLRHGGHSVTRCPNVRDALASFAVVQPDLIVLDQHMPEMDGISFLRVLRSYYRGSMVPVVLMTADSDPILPERAAALGVRRTFLKADCQLSELLHCVNELTAGCTPRQAFPPPDASAPPGGYFHGRAGGSEV